MNIHEYQGRRNISFNGRCSSRRRVAFTAEEAVEKAKEVNSDV